VKPESLLQWAELHQSSLVACHRPSEAEKDFDHFTLGKRVQSLLRAGIVLDFNRNAWKHLVELDDGREQWINLAAGGFEVVRSWQRAFGVGREDWAVEADFLIQQLRRIVVGGVNDGLSWKECFEHFDQKKRGEVRVEELQEGLMLLGMAVSRREADKLLICLGKGMRDLDPKLRMRDFLQTVAPRAQKSELTRQYNQGIVHRAHKALRSLRVLKEGNQQRENALVVGTYLPITFRKREAKREAKQENINYSSVDSSGSTSRRGSIACTGGEEKERGFMLAATSSATRGGSSAGDAASSDVWDAADLQEVLKEQDLTHSEFVDGVRRMRLQQEKERWLQCQKLLEWLSLSVQVSGFPVQ
jgi:hypothetical protein